MSSIVDKRLVDHKRPSLTTAVIWVSVGMVVRGEKYIFTLGCVTLQYFMLTFSTAINFRGLLI